MKKIASSKYYPKYIRLFEMQLQGVLEDMVGPADNLSSIFSESLMKLYDLKEEVNDYDDERHKKISARLDQIINVLQQCITDMQFVDSKRQRIEHVADGLSELNDMSQCEERRLEYEAWQKLDEKVKDQYKMKREREIYNKFLEECEVQEDNEVYLAV